MGFKVVAGSAEDSALTILGAVYGIAGGNTQYREVLDLVTREGASVAVARLTEPTQSLSNQQFGKLLLDNLNITPNSVPSASYDALSEALTIILGVYPAGARGQIALNLSRILAGLTEDITYGAAARAWVSFKDAALEYSANPVSIASQSAIQILGLTRFSGTLNSPTVNEGNDAGGVLTFTIELDKPVFGAPVTLRYSTEASAGSATAASSDSDFVPTSGVITLLPGLNRPGYRGGWLV